MVPPVLHARRFFTLRRKSSLEKLGITHIVSVLKYDFKDFEDWELYEQLGIGVDDVEDENLLGEFERTGAWIEEALKNGKDGKKGRVLVHWQVLSSLPSYWFQSTQTIHITLELLP